MEFEREIEQAIRKMSGTYLRDIVSITVCNVDAVDKGERTCDCTPISGNAATQIPSVQLMAESNNGFVVFPKVDSTVIVASSIRNIFFVIMFSDIDEISIIIDKEGGNPTTFNIKQGLQQFNDGSFDGLVKVIELTDKLNNIENLVNDLIGKYNSHTHAVAAAPGTSAVPIPIETNVLTPTQKSEIENQLITHGL